MARDIARIVIDAHHDLWILTRRHPAFRFVGRSARRVCWVGQPVNARRSMVVHVVLPLRQIQIV